MLVYILFVLKSSNFLKKVKKFLQHFLYNILCYDIVDVCLSPCKPPDFSNSGGIEMVSFERLPMCAR
jgi:hypothetical protein